MHQLARILLRTGASLTFGLAALRPVCAADLAIVMVPQGMILETQLARNLPATAPDGTPIDFVVTHDLRIGDYVVVAAGSHGFGHLTRAGRARGAATASRVRYDYVLASDGTRVPVTGSLPYLTTRASRQVVIYGVADADRRTSAAPLANVSRAPLTRP